MLCAEGNHSPRAQAGECGHEDVVHLWCDCPLQLPWGMASPGEDPPEPRGAELS